MYYFCKTIIKKHKFKSLFEFIIHDAKKQNIVWFTFWKRKPNKEFIDVINKFFRKAIKEIHWIKDLTLIIEQLSGWYWYELIDSLPMNEYSIFSFLWKQQNEVFPDSYETLYEAIEEYISKWQNVPEQLYINRSKHLDDEKPFTWDVFQIFKFKSNNLHDLLLEYQQWRLWKVFQKTWITDENIKSKYWRASIIYKIKEYIVNSYSERVKQIDKKICLEIKSNKEWQEIIDTINAILMINWFRNNIIEHEFNKKILTIKY